MIVDQLIAALDAISDRAELVAFLAPLRAPNDLPDNERARLLPPPPVNKRGNHGRPAMGR